MFSRIQFLENGKVFVTSGYNQTLICLYNEAKVGVHGVIWLEKLKLVVSSFADCENVCKGFTAVYRGEPRYV